MKMNYKLMHLLFLNNTLLMKNIYRILIFFKIMSFMKDDTVNISSKFLFDLLKQKKLVYPVLLFQKAFFY